MTDVPAVEVTGLTKVFEKGRRTIWQRVGRQPDRRERFTAVNAIDFRVERGEIFGGLWAFRAADRRIRRVGTINQY